MSEPTTPSASDVLDSLPDEVEVGGLSEPEFVDAQDDVVARRVAEAADVDDSVQNRVGSRTQQGGIKADVVVSAGRAQRAMARESEADAKITERIQKFLEHDANGYFEVERIGPVEMPSIERGAIGQIRYAELKSMPVSAFIRGQWGGGLFSLTARRGDNSLAEADAVTISVGGCDPKPTTKVGAAWLRRVQTDGILTSDSPHGAPGAGDAGMFQFMMTMLERDKERERLRADAEEARRREDAKERERLWKERQDELKAAREKELADIKEQREKEREEAKELRAREREEAKADRDRALADAKAAREAEQKTLETRLDAQLEQMKNEAAARLEQMKLDAELEREQRRILIDAQARRLETKETSGLGFDGMTELRKGIAQVMLKRTLKDAGLEEDESSPGFLGAVSDVFREEGPELLRSAANLLLPRLAAWIPGGQAAPPPPPPAPMQVQHFQPAPRALPETRPEPPADDGIPDFGSIRTQAPSADEPSDADVPDVQDAAPAERGTQPNVPDNTAVLRASMNFATAGVLQFARPLVIYLNTQPEADAAWDAPITEDGRTLTDFYRLMYREARVAVATDWPKFVQIVHAASKADGEHLEKSLAQEGAAEWLAEFLAAGPWVPDTEE